MDTTSPKRYSYYPGCSQTRSNRAYDISARSIIKALGAELEELDDWNCCGTSNYVAVDEKRSLVFSARNLALAEKTGRTDLVTSCSGCYVILRKANKYISEVPELREEVHRALAAGEMEYNDSINVRHLLDVIVNDFGEETIRGKVVRPLAGLKVAPYYGCQITRPDGEIDDEEFPCVREDMFTWVGAEPVEFPMKTKCCGGMLMTTRPEVGKTLAGKILKNAKDSGADCIATACPLCQIVLEGYQRKVSRFIGSDVRIPVFYFTQILGAAFGLTEKELLLSDSLTPHEVLLA